MSSSMPATVGFGSSHAVAIARAAEDDGLPLRILITRDEKYHPMIGRGEGAERLNGTFRRDLADAIAECDPRILFCTLQGGGYAVLGLVNHARPFRIIAPQYPEDPDSLVSADRPVDILPYDSLVETFKTYTARSLEVLRAVRLVTDLPIVRLAPPPPVGDDAHILGMPAKLLKERIEKHGLTPRNGRRAMWLAYRDAVRAQCREVNVTFLEPPRESFDDDGFLRPEYHGRDAVHANPGYGALVLRQLADLNLSADLQQGSA